MGKEEFIELFDKWSEDYDKTVTGDDRVQGSVED